MGDNGILEACFDDATAVLALPEPNRRRLRTSNEIEWLNEEERRRERAIRHPPAGRGPHGTA
jgi:putative transposase